MSHFLSVIVPTCNRQSYIEKLVPWMQAQGVDKLISELIIVNDGSSDGTRAYLDSLNDPWIRALHQNKQGKAKARQAGVDIALGDVLLFLDDDMEPGSSAFLDAHLKFHQFTPVHTVALGAIPPPKEDYWRPAYEHFFEKSIAKMYEAFRRGQLEPTGIHFFSANVSLPKNLYLKSGGFSDKFLQAEDRELGLRLEYEHSAVFAFVDSAYAYHHSPKGRYRSFIKQAYQYGRFDLKIAKNYPEHDELSPYQIFAKPPFFKMVVAKSAWTMPGLMELFNPMLIQFAKIGHRMGFMAFSIRCCSMLYCINFVLGLKDEQSYDI